MPAAEEEEEGATLSEAESRSADVAAASEAEAREEVAGETGGRPTTEGLSWAAATLRRCSVGVEGEGIGVPAAVVGSEARSEAAEVQVVAVSSQAWVVARDIE